MKLKLPLIAAFVAMLSLTACGGGSENTQPAVVVASPATLIVTDIGAPGTGAVASGTKLVQVHYTVWLYSATAADNKGTLIESSVNSAPLEFRLGANKVIPGFETGVTGMLVGGKRNVKIPSNLAYGAAGSGPIPPNAGLVFEISLLSAIN
ncbi:FKBP-type peptidyl-prolyl cis-trans isomerase [Massilia glaciei]|uniref:Peptidyl-prolyl cis-trans isomerase n=1 Tax=Massilia glaciei TaxID=1524097 RepID=A0A2U2HNU2_9BURK|nr:FKBP-type peptidyl-prolyl cis-trans isomerase [Massilia glaciei]PWF49194.1 FKBP-type peptidyl-prolyl cis-trans isomerase [Massilia glaciei]